MADIYGALLRHPDLLDENTCVLGSEANLSPEWLAYVATQKVKIQTWDWLTFQAYKEKSYSADYGIPKPHGLSDTTLVLLWPKSKVLGQSLIAMFTTLMDECYIIAANDNGGKSIKNAVKDHALESTKIDSARHCSLWHLKLKPLAQEPQAQPHNWLKLAKSFPFEQQSYMTLPGVFNHGKLDIGTELLMKNIPAPATGKLLDLGCGSGVIGLSMKARNPTLDITLADTDAFALQSCQLNSARLNLEAKVLPSDGLTEIQGRFDYIFTNPPFHQGRQTNYDFAERLLTQAPKYLTKRGQLWIVANRHLAYEDWAKASFNQVEILVQAKGFKLICAYNQ